MITVEELKNISFRRANFGGYRPEDVDTFIDDMLISYDNVIEENKKLKEKVAELQSRIEKFHEEDNSIRSIILNAQKIAENSLDEAKIKTTEMINEAVEKSSDIVKKAKEEASSQFQISERLKAECSKLKKHVEEVYRKHMELINSIPSDAKEMNKSDSCNEISSGKTYEEQDALGQTKVYDEEEDISDKMRNENMANAKDTFSSLKSGQTVNEKFKNLKFGKNVGDETGSYFGIFRKK
ncbi:MAG: DivIVA domain-containing protein [Clostridia bacterium]|nr:DivIVA domain-containing protein [Clostridia bacterium]